MISGGAVSATENLKALAVQSDATEKSTQKVSGSAKNLSASMGRMTPVISSAARAMADGGDAGQVFSSTLSDLAFVLGPALGGALGVVVGQLLPALIQGFFSASEKAISFDTAVKNLNSDISDLKKLNATYSTEGVQGLVDKYGELNNEVLRFIELQRQSALEQAARDATAAIKALQDETGNAATEVGNLASMFSITREQASDLASAISRASNARGFEDQITAMSRLRDNILRITGGTGDMTDAQFKYYQKVQSSIDALMQLNAEGRKSTGWLGAAISGASSLAGKLWDAAAAAAAVRDAQITANGKKATDQQIKDTYGLYAFTRKQTPDLPPANLPVAGQRPKDRPMDLGSEIASGVGSASSVSTEMDDRLATLMEKLQTEKETLDTWHQDGLETLNEALANEKITQEQHKDYLLRLEEDYQKELSGIRQDGVAGALGEASDLFSNLAKLSQDGSGKLLQISKAFGAAEALINTYRAAAQALADPKLGFFQKFAAVASVIAAGIGLVNAIKGGGKASAGSASTAGTTGSGVSTTTSTAKTDEPLPPQRVILELPAGQMISAEFMKEMFTRFYDQNKNRGVVFQVSPT